MNRPAPVDTDRFFCVDDQGLLVMDESNST